MSKIYFTPFNNPFLQNSSNSQQFFNFKIKVLLNALKCEFFFIYNLYIFSGTLYFICIYLLSPCSLHRRHKAVLTSWRKSTSTLK